MMITVKMKNDRDALQCCRGPELMMADYRVNMRAKWTLGKKKIRRKKSWMEEIRNELMMAHFRQRNKGKRERERDDCSFLLLCGTRKCELRLVHNKLNPYSRWFIK
jgi:hypothetical protein